VSLRTRAALFVVVVCVVLGAARPATSQLVSAHETLTRATAQRLVSTKCAVAFADVAATRGDPGAGWGPGNEHTFITAILYLATAPPQAGFLYVFDPASERYRFVTAIANTDPFHPGGPTEVAAVRASTTHLYPIPGETPTASTGARLGRDVADFRRALGGDDAFAALSLLLAVASVPAVLLATAAFLVQVIPVVSAAIARHRAISEARAYLARRR